jgi:hypothetical protein
MELASHWRGDQPGGLTMAAIPFVFTIARVAEMLGEDEEWLREISINMDPEEGHLWVIGIGEDQCPHSPNTALNASGKSSSKSARFSRKSPRETRSVCGAHRRLT